MIFYYLFVYVTVYLIRTENKINIEISQIYICDFRRSVIAIIQQLLISLYLCLGG